MYLILSMLIVLWFDITRYIIPNWLVGLMLVAYPIAVVMSHNNINWVMALAGMVLMLFAGYGIFIMKWMGAGDIKLLTACALWVGWNNLMEFIIYVAFIGGVFSIIVLAARKALPFLPRKPDAAPLPRILHDKAPIPYGVAIAFGLLLMLFQGRIPVA